MLRPTLEVFFLVCPKSCSAEQSRKSEIEREESIQSPTVYLSLCSVVCITEQESLASNFCSAEQRLIAKILGLSNHRAQTKKKARIKSHFGHFLALRCRASLCTDPEKNLKSGPQPPALIDTAFVKDNAFHK